MNNMTFEEHMKSRGRLFTDCRKATIGKDFAVFEFDDKEAVAKAMNFAEACNKIYEYTFASNLTDKLVCFNA